MFRVLFSLYLFIGLLTGLAFIELMKMMARGELDETWEIDNLEDYSKMINENQKLRVTFVLVSMVIWPSMWLTCKPKNAIKLILAFISDLIKGHH